MRADETRLEGLLAGRTQYVVPYFQRSYSWERQQWRVLYDDILELHDSGGEHQHFLGSTVLLNEGGESDEILIIDGQQRLVTLCLLLAAMRDSARTHLPELSERLDRALVLERGPRVLCTYQDRAAFAAVITKDGELTAGAPIGEAYRFYGQALANERKLDPERLEHIIFKQLSFVAITLDADDNPYRIFESLNAKGMPLTQGDLLRNYFFMRLPRSEHDSLYTSIWTPMQTRLGKRFDDFMRDYLIKEGDPVRPDEVYQGWRKRLGPLDQDGVREVLRDVAEWSVEYDRLLHPQREADPAVRKRLERLTTWSGTIPHSIHPFLLRLRGDYSRERIGADEVAGLLGAVESYFVRRLFVSPPPVDENRLFMDLYAQAANGADRAHGFSEALARPQLGWPGDADFREAVVRYPLYFGSHPDQRVIILQALEDSFEHRFPVDFGRLELEFVAPLLPRTDWLAELGVGEEAYWRLVGTLGNLTWTAKGRSPGLPVAERKRELQRMLRYNVELDRDFSQIERWTAAELEARSRRLAERAVEIWPGPVGRN